MKNTVEETRGRVLVWSTVTSEKGSSDFVDHGAYGEPPPMYPEKEREKNILGN